MATLKNHPGFWLRDDAAAALNAYETKHGVLNITSAGRTESEQQGLISRWDRGGWLNRPPYLYPPARPAKTSPHVRDGGIAVDTSDWQKFRKHCEDFGFYWYGGDDPVHFNFLGWDGGFDQDTKNRQAWLVSRGWNLVVDGIEGPATRQAYREYQGQLNTILGVKLAVDGIWGPETQKAHQRFYDSIHSKRPSDKKAWQLTYADIQEALNRHGYRLVVDNIWGRKSSDALADFQRKNGLVVDRIVGDKTWEKLNR